MIQEDWDIQPRSNVCQGCSTPFADKATYHTLLSFTPDGYQRLDICQTCWDAQYQHGAMDRKGAFSHWRGRYQAPPPPQPEPIQRETAESLLRKLIESKDPVHANARYILAVMLERKRLLKHRDTVEQEGQRILIYEHARTGESLLIPDPGLQLDQLAAIQQQVLELLSPPKPQTGPASAGADGRPDGAVADAAPRA